MLLVALILAGCSKDFLDREPLDQIIEDNHVFALSHQLAHGMRTNITGTADHENRLGIVHIPSLDV